MVSGRRELPERHSDRRGADRIDTDREVTLVGHERSEQVSRHNLVLLRSLGPRPRDRAPLGLFLLSSVLLLDTLALIGMAAGLFTESVAVQVLAVTIIPLFTVWILIIRWAFRR